ncbi:hypothetical protein [Chryseobacterium sp. OSA05B]|uniref:hypothetical protein n=1 Tax=Chryseobacterium sp. OSA05B TaxID=2862650 RepID=UPI001CBE2C38|nr:hypothetical protein [Chryseobacterium sp. OSA05B]
MKNIRSLGALALSYYMPVNNGRLMLGASAVFDRLDADIVNRSTNKKESKKSITAITVAGEGKYKYTNNPQFNIYGLVGVGYTFGNASYDTNPTIEDNANYNHFNFQFSPLGLEYGTDFKGILELGIGYKGIASAGVQYNF